MLTLRELRAHHLAEASRLLTNGDRELNRVPMRVSTADVAAWSRQASFHLDAVELVDGLIAGPGLL